MKGESKKMPSKAKAYITLVIASGMLLLFLAAGSWSSSNLRQFAIDLGLAALASALKVRIPGIEGTISPNFVFLLLGMVALPFSQVAVISLAAALVQSLSASAKRPRLVQVAFNAAALVVSSSLAYKFAHLVLAGSATESALVCVILAGSIYFPVDSGLVSMVISLAEGQPFKRVCLRCYQWAFPYFMGGIAFAGLVSGAYAPSMLWKGALILLPATVLAYLYFANLTARVASATMPVSASEEEQYAEIHS
jgi:MASE9 protein